MKTSGSRVTTIDRAGVLIVTNRRPGGADARRLRCASIPHSARVTIITTGAYSCLEEATVYFRAGVSSAVVAVNALGAGRSTPRYGITGICCAGIVVITVNWFRLTPPQLVAAVCCASIVVITNHWGEYTAR